MNIISIIPARGGSKGISNKNKRLFLGHPLVTHSIMYSQASNIISKTYVTSDEQEILEFSRDYGACIIERPSIISGDMATTESAIEHALSQINPKPDAIVLLQPTSPLRPDDSLDRAINQFLEQQNDSLLSLSASHNFFWKVSNNNAYAQYDFMKRPMRQQINNEDIQYIENGSLYIFKTDHFLNHKNRLGGNIGYVIFDEEYSKQIDTDLDFLYLESLGEKLINRKLGN